MTENNELQEAFRILERQSSFLGTDQDALLVGLRRMIVTERRTHVPLNYAGLARNRLQDALQIASLLQPMNPNEENLVIEARALFKKNTSLPAVPDDHVDIVQASPVSVIEQASRVFKERTKQYGPSSESCKLIADFFSVVLQHTVDPKLIPLMMIGMKIARHIVGGSTDDLVDICGYAEVAHQVEQS
jgi:hypothetical protein